jgi:hypothetical protein
MTLNELKQSVLIELISILKQVEEDEGIEMQDEIETLEEEMQGVKDVNELHNLLTESGYCSDDAYRIIINHAINQ